MGCRTVVLEYDHPSVEGNGQLLELKGTQIIFKSLIVSKGTQHQQIVEEAAQVLHTSGDTLSEIGNQKLLGSIQQIVKQCLLQISEDIPFIVHKLGNNEAHLLSEAKTRALILMLSKTRTQIRTITSSADSQVRAPGIFQMMLNQCRDQDEIMTREIFARNQTEEMLQSQSFIGMREKTARYLQTWKLVKGDDFIQKGFFQIFKNEDSEKWKVKPFKDSNEISLPISPANRLCENKSIEEEKLERVYDITIEDPTRTILDARNSLDIREDDTGCERSRVNHNIIHFLKDLGSEFGIRNWRQPSASWRIEERFENMDRQQEGNGGYFFRSVQLLRNHQIAADQSDPNKVRQLYHSITYCQIECRRIIRSGNEEDRWNLSITENTNTDSTYSGNIEQDNNALSKLSTQGDYSVKKEVFIALCQAQEIIPTLDFKYLILGDNSLILNPGKEIIRKERTCYHLEKSWHSSWTKSPLSKEIINRVREQSELAKRLTTDVHRKIEIRYLKGIFSNNWSLQRLDERESIFYGRPFSKGNVIHSHRIHDVADKDKENKAIISKSSCINILHIAVTHI
ncbi:MAG: hypothetical protein EZS28_005416 [Streblomastix strix]|uniref:Uncharacterized protein n=1 Tax=Streblomastix strix TaxID=222440 RepID=A0A5J4WX15_9EUKA|nr:MAG: hypothetical protein EZS28_005416 [Streblomastix strix]